MRRILQATFLGSAIVSGALGCAIVPACAQMDQMGDEDAAISFDSFHDQLAPYGNWLYSDRWGVVWQPADVPYDFRPYYTAGHWVYTDDYGWYWVSKYEWGEIPFHYGRWVNDPDDGWLWIPGYIWSPGWVAWRSNGAYIGWMPLPPDDAFLQGRGDIGVSFRFAGFDVGALYARWYGPVFNERRFAANWVFLPAGFISMPDYQRVVIRDPVRLVTIIHQTRNVTNYTVVNNVVVNRSVDVRVVERAAGHPIPVVRSATIIRHPSLVARVDIGQRIQLRMREIAPHGRGLANSAPPPPARIVGKLSVNVRPVNGRAPVHLFSKSTVTAPEAQSRFKGMAPRASGAGEMRGAGGEPKAVGPEKEAAPTPEGMRNEQPNPKTGLSGEGTRPERPNNMATPNGNEPGTQPPVRERARGGPAAGASGLEQPNGAAGPQRIEREHPGAESPPNGESNGPPSPASERTRRGPPQAAPVGNEQPNSSAPPNNPRMGREPPATGPNESPRPDNMKPPNSTSGQQPGGGNGNGNPDNGAPPPRHKKKQDQNAPPPPQ